MEGNLSFRAKLVPVPDELRKPLYSIVILFPDFSYLLRIFKFLVELPLKFLSRNIELCNSFRENVSEKLLV